MTFPTAPMLRLVAGLALVVAAAVAGFWPRPAERSQPEPVAGAIDDDARLAALERRIVAGAQRAQASVVTLEYKANGAADGARRMATGVVIDGLGHVLSIRIEPPKPSESAGAPSGEEPARIIARDALGRRRVADWIAADPDTGLTLLKIPAGAPRPIEPAAEGPTLGGRVFVVGNPFGLGQSVSRGQISGLNRSLNLRSQPLHGLIQVQAPLFPGDSGAVVADLQGRWLGLIRGGLAAPAAMTEEEDGEEPSRRSNDLGFAIPAERALWIAARLRDHGKVDRAYLGVRLEDDDDDAPEGDGARLRDVLPNTPAARAGLHVGDRVTAFDGQPIRSALELTERLDRSPAHHRARLEVVRDGGGGAGEIEVQTASRPEPLVPPSAAGAGAALEVVPTAATLAEPTLLERLDRLEKRVEQLESAAYPNP